MIYQLRVEGGAEEFWVVSSENLRRLITAAIVLPFLYLYITMLPAPFFLILLILISVLAQIEFHAMYKAKRLISFVGIVSGIFLIAVHSLLQLPAGIQPLIFIIPFVLTTSVRLFFIKDPSFSLKDISPALIGFLYIPNLLLSQWHLRLEGYEWIILLYGCVWASDSLAYYAGKGIGKRRLYSTVSPNKTVEGAFGSVIGGVLSALILESLLGIVDSYVKLIIMGAAVGAVTIVGDLVESMFKRDAGVKDSNTFIPGHGGILDKIDGILFAGPVLYLLTVIL